VETRSLIIGMEFCSFIKKLSMKKIKYLFPVLAFIAATFITCANGGNSPGPNDSTDNSLIAKPDSNSVKNSLTDTLHDNKDTMKH
jgi:hypothetical protein